MALVSCGQAEAPGGLVTSLGVPRLSPRWREGPHTTGGRRETKGWVQELLGRCLQVSSTMGHPHSHPHLLEPRWKVLLIHPWDSTCVLWWLQKHLGNLSFLQPNPPGCLCPTRGGASPEPPGWGGDISTASLSPRTSAVPGWTDHTLHRAAAPQPTLLQKGNSSSLGGKQRLSSPCQALEPPGDEVAW